MLTRSLPYKKVRSALLGIWLDREANATILILLIDQLQSDKATPVGFAPEYLGKSPPTLSKLFERIEVVSLAYKILKE